MSTRRPRQRAFSFEHDDHDSPITPPPPSHEHRSSLSYRRSPPYPTVPRRHDDDTPPPPPVHRLPVVPVQPATHPTTHPSSAFHQLQSQRFYGHRPIANTSVQTGHPALLNDPGQADRNDLLRRCHSPPSTSITPGLPISTDSSDLDSPRPAARRSIRRAAPSEEDGRYWGSELGYSASTRTTQTATPGVDNLGETAVGGGITGIALGVAAFTERESGIEALRGVDESARAFPINASGALKTPLAMENNDSYRPSSRSPPPYSTPARAAPAAAPMGPDAYDQRGSDISLDPYPSPDRYSPERSSPERNSYMENPFVRYSSTWDPRVAQPHMGGIDPNDIEDDGDDGLEPQGNRGSMLSLGHSGHNILPAAAGGAAAGGAFAALRGMFGRKPVTQNPAGNAAGGQYGPVPGVGYNPGGSAEKSEWLTRQRSGNKRLQLIVGVLLALVIVGAIVGGVVGGVLGSRKSKASSASSAIPGTAAADDGQGDLNKNSAEIKQLMGNPNLHKVFPGIDYTPWGVQYPDCLKWPPSQNNVTRDVAVLSQLTNKVRLYGTDCNQTQMVLHSISALGLTDMKVWLGIWQDTNATDNSRQMDIFHDIIDKYGGDPFAGVIVGNEVMFRKDMTESQLAQVIHGVKSNLTSKNINIPVATSDIGDDWTADLAASVDIVMANVHPFFAGVTADQAAGWTYDFWQTHDVALATAAPNKPKNIVSEVGWPSAGGNDCGGSNCTSPTQGSIAGIDEMNTFMDSFICQSLSNGTEYFWFEAFDEPWKVVYNTPGQDWEDKWGLMDAGRNIKSGLKIPDCGGKTVS